MTPEEFWDGIHDGRVTGHVGFAQSFAMFEEALNIRFTRTEQIREPIISGVPRATEAVLVLPGQVAGCRHIGRAYIDERLFLELEHPQQVRPEAEGIVTADSIEIEGVPTIRMQGSPEIPGGVGTIAMCVNMIPHVLSASPGLMTMLDLPAPRGFLAEIH
jgi:4-hydroxy-tetrahydrodipicolinate reductase